jgi:hypothetical protein
MGQERIIGHPVYDLCSNDYSSIMDSNRAYVSWFSCFFLVEELQRCTAHLLVHTLIYGGQIMVLAVVLTEMLR